MTRGGLEVAHLGDALSTEIAREVRSGFSIITLQTIRFLMMLHFDVGIECEKFFSSILWMWSLHLIFGLYRPLMDLDFRVCQLSKSAQLLSASVHMISLEMQQMSTLGLKKVLHWKP